MTAKKTVTDSYTNFSLGVCVAIFIRMDIKETLHFTTTIRRTKTANITKMMLLVHHRPNATVLQT